MAVKVNSTRKAVEIAWATSGGETEPSPPETFPPYPVDPGYGIEEGGPPTATHPIYLPPYIDNSLPGDQPYPDIGGPGDQPKPDQGLPGDQPRPDQGLPGDQPRPDQGLPGDQPKPDQTLPGDQPKPDQGLPAQPDSGYEPPSVAIPTPVHDEVLAVQVFAQGQEGDWSNGPVMRNDGLAVLTYPKDFKGESYIEVRSLDGSLVDSGTITVK